MAVATLDPGIDFLLGSDEPVIRYRALVDVVGAGDHDRRVVEALAGLRVLAESGHITDPRTADVLDLLESRRRAPTAPGRPMRPTIDGPGRPTRSSRSWTGWTDGKTGRARRSRCRPCASSGPPVA